MGRVLATLITFFFLISNGTAHAFADEPTPTPTPKKLKPGECDKTEENKFEDPKPSCKLRSVTPSGLGWEFQPAVPRVSAACTLSCIPNFDLTAGACTAEEGKVRHVGAESCRPSAVSTILRIEVPADDRNCLTARNKFRDNQDACDQQLAADKTKDRDFPNAYQAKCCRKKAPPKVVPKVDPSKIAPIPPVPPGIKPPPKVDAAKALQDLCLKLSAGAGQNSFHWKAYCGKDGTIPADATATIIFGTTPGNSQLGMSQELACKAAITHCKGMPGDGTARVEPTKDPKDEPLPGEKKDSDGVEEKKDSADVDTVTSADGVMTTLDTSSKNSATVSDTPTSGRTTNTIYLR